MTQGFFVTMDTTRGIRNASKHFERVANEAAYSLASFLVNEIKEGILQQRYSLAAKSYEWAKRSKDPRPLIHTRDYIDSLYPTKLKGGGAAIGGNLMLAKLHEGGTRTMPARPHIRPAINTLNQKLGNVIGEGFLYELLGG